MALQLKARALHFVLRVTKRSLCIKFYKDILGMKVLRHEEFAEGCEASCNGAYNNRWSKTMMGYGPESNHFVVELTYNYGVSSYEMGDDFLGITIKSDEILKRAKQHDWSVENLHGNYTIEAPEGYKFNIIDESLPSGDPVQKVTLASSNLQKTIAYWNGILGLAVIYQKENCAAFAFGENQCLLEFKDFKRPINHGQAYGRIAFAVPESNLPEIQKRMESEKQKVLTPLISLSTPGKATVSVVILADPDGHEICFVNEEGFSKLSEFDPKADADLSKCIKSDKTENNLQRNSSNVISNTQ